MSATTWMRALIQLFELYHSHGEALDIANQRPVGRATLLHCKLQLEEHLCIDHPLVGGAGSYMANAGVLDFKLRDADDDMNGIRNQATFTVLCHNIIINSVHTYELEDF